MLTRPLLLALVSSGFLGLVGCREAKIAEYRVPKEKAPPPAIATSTTGLPQLKWKTPAGWKEQPAGNVRLASFLITGDEGKKAEMAITQFPGDVGGDLANINRWRNQLQLGPIAEGDLSKSIKPLDLPLGHFLVTDIVSETPVLEGKHHARTLGAWLKQPDRTWFFKLSGESDLVTSQRASFEAFLRSLEFAPSEPMEMAETAGNTSAPPPAPVSSAAPAPTAGGPLTWTPPSDWIVKPLSPMRKGSFTLTGTDGAKADLSIISFPGEAGGIVENLNRWRGQIQLPPLGATELASSAHTLANGGLRFTVVDYVGTTADGPTRVMGAVLPLETETYFFKLMGPDAVVSQHKTAFMDFLKTVKAP